MAHIKTIVEVSWDEEGREKKDNYYLLHFGLKYDLAQDGHGNLVPVHYTVAICQNIKSGAIEMFLPDQLRVLGVNLRDV